MNKKQKLMAEKAKELVAHRIAKHTATRLYKFMVSPLNLDNKPAGYQCLWVTKIMKLCKNNDKLEQQKAALEAQRLAHNAYLKTLSKEAREQYTLEYLKKQDAERAKFYANEKDKALYKAKLLAKPTKKLLVGECPSALKVKSDTLYINCGNFDIWETRYDIYTSKPLYKSQVAEIFGYWDSEFSIDLTYYTFKPSWNHFKVGQEVVEKVKVNNDGKKTLVTIRGFESLKWSTMNNPIDFWGDIKLYEADLMTYEELLKKYSKTININWLADPTTLNKSIKSLIRIAKILSTKEYYQGPVWSEEDPFRWNEFTINVKINKYVFTLINSGLRNTEFIHWRLTDDMLPVIPIGKINYNLLDYSTNKWEHDKKPTGLTVDKDGDYHYLYLNGVRLHSFIPDYTINCNENIYSNIWKEINPNRGYRLLKNLLCPWEDYSKADIKACIKWEIINKVYGADETAIVFRGNTDKVTSNIEDVYYYIRNNELNIDFKKVNYIFIRIIPENDSYTNANDLDKLSILVESKIRGHNTRKALQRHQDALADIIQISNTLEADGIEFSDTIYDNVYKLRIDR